MATNMWGVPDNAKCDKTDTHAYKGDDGYWYEEELEALFADCTKPSDSLITLEEWYYENTNEG